MVRGYDTFFHWVRVWTQLTFPVAEGSKGVLRVLKLEFIQLDGLKMRKWGWCVHGCWVTLAHSVRV